MRNWLDRMRVVQLATPYGVVALQPTYQGLGWFSRFLGKLKDIGIAFMGAMTNFEEAAYLDYRFRGQASLNQPASFYVGLFTVTPGETGGGTEISGNGYARLEMAQADWTVVTAGEPSTIENAAQETFAAASGGNWGTAVAISLNDAAVAGNMTHFAALATSKTINDGDNAKFNAGALKVGMS